jgi:AcrR family transcriptional regulator
MGVSYQATGRVRQKARTHGALVQATRELLRTGVTPSVEQAADAAGVSRTTAYRYFPTQRARLAASFPQLGQESLLGDAPPAGVAARVAAFADAMTRLILDNEAEMRAMLRLSLEPDVEPREVALRGGKRLDWAADALAPLRDELPADELERLALAVAAAVGIEAFVWLVDVGGAPRERAAEIMRSAAAAILAGARTAAERR